MMDDVINGDGAGGNEDLGDWCDVYPDDAVTAYLYRRDSGANVQVSRFDAPLPSPHEIGQKYGSGSYKMTIRRAGARSTSRNFVIGTEYDSGRSAATPMSGIVQPQITPDMIASAVQSGVSGLLSSVASALAPILPSIIGAFQRREPSYVEKLDEVYGSVNKILERNVSEHNRMMRAHLSEIMSLQNVALGERLDSESETDNGGRVNTIASTAVKFLAPVMDSILSGGGESILSGVKDNLLFRMITSDQAIMADIESWVADNYGVDAVVILKGLLK